MAEPPRDPSCRFRTERFDYRSELPAEANAGNRFYGRDLAEFLAARLAGGDWSTSVVEEDWGWLVLGKSAAERFIEIAVYNLGDDAGGGQPGSNEWGLWIRAFEKRRWLGLVPRSHEIELPADVAARLQAALHGAGIEPEPWQR